MPRSHRIDVAGETYHVTQRLNMRHAQAFNRRGTRRGHVFEGRFKDRLIESDSHRLESARYIHLNPCRVGMCKEPEQYEWSDHGSTIGLYGSDFIVDASVELEPFGTNIAVARAN